MTNSTTSPNTSSMISPKAGGLALILSSAGMLVTMGLHPTGHIASGQLPAMAHLAIVVHSIGIFSVPLLFLGGWALTRVLAAPNSCAAVALTLFGFALVAVVNDAALNGLTAPHLFRYVLDPQYAADAKAWRAILEYSGYLSQAFSSIYVAGSALAILLWSVAILKKRELSRGLAIYGCVLGPLLTLATLSGRIQFDVHGFGAVVVIESIWFIIAGAQLYRHSPKS